MKLNLEYVRKIMMSVSLISSTIFGMGFFAVSLQFDFPGEQQFFLFDRAVPAEYVAMVFLLVFTLVLFQQIWGNKFSEEEQKTRMDRFLEPIFARLEPENPPRVKILYLGVLTTLFFGSFLGVATVLSLAAGMLIDLRSPVPGFTLFAFGGRDILKLAMLLTTIVFCIFFGKNNFVALRHIFPGAFGKSNDHR